jgi:hypothetical protein
MPELTRVVNVKAGTPYTVYIGRANGRYRLRQSMWHNPFRIGQDGTRDEVLARYRAYLLSRPELLAQIGEPRGQTPGCWCAPVGGFQGQLLCHGQVLAALADGLPLEHAGDAG